MYKIIKFLKNRGSDFPNHNLDSDCKNKITKIKILI